MITAGGVAYYVCVPFQDTSTIKRLLRHGHCVILTIQNQTSTLYTFLSRWQNVLVIIYSILQKYFVIKNGKGRGSGSAFIKPDQRNPWIKDQIKITLLPTISHLLLPNFVSCGRACPSHMTQNLVTVGAKLRTADRFIVDP